MYLGDGVISRGPRDVFRLRISTDKRYPLLIEESATAVRAVMPSSRVHVQHCASRGLVEINSYSKSWPCYFPQHGEGPKHKRPIVLEAWQETLVTRNRRQFLRGLIHSDGCRVQNRVNGKDYPRYVFTQVSGDIRALFCTTCEQLGVEFTISGKNVSIARRGSVIQLDDFIGPKR